MEYKIWRKARLDRMLVEYLLRQGYYETALGLSHTAGVGELTNTEVGIHYFSPRRSVKARLFLECEKYLRNVKNYRGIR